VLFRHTRNLASFSLPSPSTFPFSMHLFFIRFLLSVFPFHFLFLPFSNFIYFLYLCFKVIVILFICLRLFVLFLEQRAQSDIREMNVDTENHKNYGFGKVVYFCRSEIICEFNIQKRLENKNMFKLHSVSFTITAYSIYHHHHVPEGLGVFPVP